MNHTRLMVFCKAPVPGKVKTRLIQAVGEEGAAQLQKYLIYRTLKTTAKVKDADTELHCTPGTTHPFFQNCREQFGIKLIPQIGSNLGERMLHAASMALPRAQQVILIGTDCPALDEHYLEQAIENLQHGADAVLGPALDGGYVLLGLRRVESELFSDIEWGTSHVLEQTRLRLSKLKWRWQELSPMRDVDRPEDLDAYPELAQYKIEPKPERLTESDL